MSVTGTPLERARGHLPRRLAVPPARDRAIDMAVVFACLVLAEPARRLAGVGVGDPGALIPLPGDLALGILSALALWWRRSRPVAIALAIAVVGIVSQSAGPAGLVALFTVAIHRSWRTTGLVALWTLATIAAWALLNPGAHTGAAATAITAVVLVALVAGAGRLVRLRRSRIAGGASGLLPEVMPGGRTRRDFIVDVIGVLLALVSTEPLRFIAYDGLRSPPGDAFMWVDLMVGVLASLLIWWRRRFPVQLALLLGPLTILSQASGGAATIALFTVAVHRPLKLVAPVALWQAVGFAVWALLYPSEELDFWMNILVASLVTAVTVAWGMYIRSRRELLTSLRERAERAEAEQAMRTDRARLDERTRIAREMHDVLAHRVSLIALHAGALEFDERGDPAARQTAELIRSTARLALEDLRGVIGVLRAGGSTEVVPEAPQPTLRDLPRLVADARRSGQRVDLESTLADPDAAPDTIGRDAFRVIQEALTNARKHARGTPAVVRVGGGPGEGLAIEVRNRLPLHAAVGGPALPASGFGLVGLTERVELAGGSIAHGPEGDDFVVRAWLAWPALLRGDE